MAAATARSARKPHSGKRMAWGVASIIVVTLLASTAWAVRNWSRSAADLTNLDRFTVEPRTFNVVLKEKGELKAAKSADIICDVEGRTTIISLIPEGSAVKEGDLLVELASNQIEDRIRQEELKEANAITAFEAAKAELEIQRDKNASDIRKGDLGIELNRLELEKYQKGDWEQRLKDAQIAIDQARITLERRKQDYDAAKELFARNFITQTEYQEDEFNYQKAIWDLEKAEKAKEVLETYTHVAELRRRESDLQEAIKEAGRTGKNAEAEETKKLRAVEGREKELLLIQDQLAKLRQQKEKCRIVAPTQGFVVYYAGSGGGRWGMSSDSQIKEGAEVHERQILMQLPDTSAMIVALRVHEAKTDKLRLGQPATITVEGVPGVQFTGKVGKIAAVADSQSGWLNPDLKEYETEIHLDPTDLTLKPGVTAYVEIQVERVEEKLAVPVQSVYTKGSRRYVFRDEKGGVAPVEVKIGAIGMEWVEIPSGLNASDRVLLAFSEEQKRLVPDTGPRSRQPGGSPQGAAAPGAAGGAEGARVAPAGGAPGGGGERRRPRDGARPGGGRAPGGSTQQQGAPSGGSGGRSR
ncbi:MAG: efflux RND transporter periplasmic adaptor subunit [Planctomycetes bacterium]|nr:efflux RND transporter periplasmic adaptor subunit [Planctomycetota bacterium]